VCSSKSPVLCGALLGLGPPFKNSCRGSARLLGHETDREQTVSTRKHFTQRSEGDSRKRNASLCPAGRL
jgi:hypothetical protein